MFYRKKNIFVIQLSKTSPLRIFWYAFTEECKSAIVGQNKIEFFSNMKSLKTRLKNFVMVIRL